jgi:ABC-type multidrug transport system ATPase subunit
MISIHADKLGKRFNREWIFRHFTEEITAGEKLVITGSNGSGKSTLLLMLAGYIVPTEGKLDWEQEGKTLEKESWYKLTSFASPAMELIEEFTPVEAVRHQATFKAFQRDIPLSGILQIAELEKSKGKYIKHFSSGMKQRLKLTLAILADCPLLFLDEPVTNLDKNAIQWYARMIEQYAMHKTIVVCSNQVREEYAFCQREISVNDYKKV